MRSGNLALKVLSVGGLYIGGGKMIHAPRTGEPVQISSIYAPPYYGEFAGGRRFAP